MVQLQLIPSPQPPSLSQPPPQNVATPLTTTGTQAPNISVAVVNQSSIEYNNPSLVGNGRAQNSTQYASENYKSILQQYAQKARLLLPDYAIVNEGYLHAPQFRATVSIGGKQFTSPNTFAQRKVAEQDAAKHAMENMPPLTNKEEPLLLNIREDKMFCKSILNELVMKIDVEKATYSTVQPDASVHAFKSTIVFNGYSYTGEVGRNKREAEQLAARAVILSLLESEYKTVLSEIIQSKDKLYASINKVSHISTGVNTGNGVLMENNPASQQSSIVQNTTTQVAQPPHHEFQKPGLEHPKPIEESSTLTSIPPTICVPTSLLPSLIVFVPPKVQEYVQQAGGKKRKRKSKNKANKHIQVGSQASFVLAHPSEGYAFELLSSAISWHEDQLSLMIT